MDAPSMVSAPGKGKSRAASFAARLLSTVCLWGVVLAVFVSGFCINERTPRPSRGGALVTGLVMALCRQAIQTERGVKSGGSLVN